MSKDFDESKESHTAVKRSELTRKRAADSAWSDLNKEHSEISHPTSSANATDLSDNVLRSAAPSDQTWQRREYDTGRFRTALDSLDVHPETLRKAVECGQLMAHGCKFDQWAQTDRETRYETFARLAKVNSAVLGTGQIEITVVPGASRLSNGWSRPGKIAVSDHIINDDDSRNLVEVVAHESRHQWQRSVISGERDHPEGATGRARLVDAARRYDTDRSDLDGAYFENELELDAEAFARVAVLAYEAESIALMKIKAGTDLAGLAIDEYTK